jgi:ribosomal-protein-alanine N-acetyltransferase
VPWQGDRSVALVGPARHGRGPREADILACADQLDRWGVERAVTPALSVMDSQPFLGAGFQLLERLHLLSRPLHKEPLPPSRPIRLGRTWHRRAVLDIDRRAFDDFWQFDATSLRESRNATPSSRFTVVVENGDVLGYAVTGRAGSRGYLQRLAVDPTRAGEGIGTDLVKDSLRWVHARGVQRIMVNTQERNQRALDLYHHLGFETEPEGLVVLERCRP